MKIYVDEIPKSCCGCLFQDYETSSCCMDDSINCAMQDDKKAKNCPLHPVAERDAEVRKEVVGEMKELAKNEFEFLVCDECYNTIDGDVYISSVALSEILDQVERREDNERNS